MSARTPSSDRHRPLGPVTHGRLVVLEGMPGAGKTTAAESIATGGICVLGEYTTGCGTTIPIAAHPAPGDDVGHQVNWLRKAAQASSALATGGLAVCDRDWLSSLAYAYSIADRDGGHLSRLRAAWATSCLDNGTLLLPGTYVIFHLDVATSLHRRAGRLNVAHPWSHQGPLRRLERFYANPGRAVAEADTRLAAVLCQARWRYLSGHDSPQQVSRAARDLAGCP